MSAMLSRASRRALSSPASRPTRPSHPGPRASASASMALASAASTTSDKAETPCRLESLCVASDPPVWRRQATLGDDVSPGSSPALRTCVDSPAYRQGSDGGSGVAPPKPPTGGAPAMRRGATDVGSVRPPDVRACFGRAWLLSPHASGLR
jgi:hypothetical protein